MENDKKSHLETLIEKSVLSDDDKKFWSTMISRSPADFMETIYEALSVFPDELVWFNDIFKKKQAAFALFETDKENGMEVLREIYREERKKLDELNSK